MGWSQEKVRIGEFVDARNLDMRQVDIDPKALINTSLSGLQNYNLTCWKRADASHSRNESSAPTIWILTPE